MLAPEREMKAALRILHIAGVITRNSMLSEDVPREQMYDLWEALHELPSVLTRWEERSEAEVLAWFADYNQKWKQPDLRTMWREE